MTQLTQTYGFWRKISQHIVILILIILPLSGAFRIDIPNTSFEVFGKHIWWNEVALTLGFIATAISSYFIISALYGRVFCGWACPQNLWGEISDWFEYRLFGQSTMHETKVMYVREPWHGPKKYLLFVTLVLFLIMMGTWIWLVIGSYFVPTSQLLYGLAHPNTIVLGSLGIVIGLATVYSFMGHWWCKNACPVGMLPFLLWTKKTMSLQFDSVRKHECERCNKCFPACIVQINVKDSGDSKRWCFNCGACVDTCTTVQTAHNNNTKPPLLQIHKGKGKVPVSVYIASAVLAISISVFVYGIYIHKNMEISITADRTAGQMYTKNARGETEINYAVKVHNKDSVIHNLQVTIDGLPASSYRISAPELPLPAGESTNVRINVTLNDPLFVPHKTHKFTVTVADRDKPDFRETGTGILVVP